MNHWHCYFLAATISTCHFTFGRPENIPYLTSPWLQALKAQKNINPDVRCYRSLPPIFLPCVMAVRAAACRELWNNPSLEMALGQKSKNNIVVDGRWSVVTWLNEKDDWSWFCHCVAEVTMTQLVSWAAICTLNMPSFQHHVGLLTGLGDSVPCGCSEG